PAELPSAFAKIRALDQTGGILGPMIAVLLWGQVPVRDLLWGTALPGIFCLLFANRAARLAARPIANLTAPGFSSSISPVPRHAPRFRVFLLASFLIRIGLFPATLLMFQFGKTTGLPRIMGLGFVLASVAHVGAALWLSKQARTGSPWKLIFSGSTILVLALLVLGFGGRVMPLYFLAMVLWGTAEVLLTVGSKSLIPHLVSHEERLGAYGLWEIAGAVGMILFQPAISLFWDQGKFLAGFLGATLAVVLGMIILLVLYKKTAERQQAY
ncbi:MAG: MFS transporter, partial [Leptospirales bacterium]